MKDFFIFFIFYFFISQSFGQQTKTSADTFSFSKNRMLKKIIIRSDSTYLLCENGFEHSFLGMGFFTKQNDTLLLSGLYNLAIAAKSEFNNSNSLNDSFVIFKVQDYYGNSIPKYHINVYDKNLMFDTSHDTNNRTDNNGILKVRKNKFSFYTTETDETNVEDFRGFWNDIFYRPISQNANIIVITLSFPKSLLAENFENNFYMFHLKKFILKNNELLDFDSENKYLKK